MFTKNEIKRGDKICFNDSDFLEVFEVTNKYLVVGINKYLKKSIRLSDFRVVKINGRYHAFIRLASVWN
ncbi:hypothetical protein [Lactococcus lactis]|uniref:hypothetical protein n=1 Tax=Lactococcus lactis TaxID=1358 RepID=UPI0024A8635B|nr:hypothetical protein [Lactococcus lactis]